jgi:hypothetical protein
LFINLLNFLDEQLIIVDNGFDQGLLCNHKCLLELFQKGIAMLDKFLSDFCFILLLICFDVAQQLLDSFGKPI